jgi:hypothetical protein
VHKGGRKPTHMGRQVKPGQEPSRTRGKSSGLRPGGDESGAARSVLMAARSALQQPGAHAKGGNGQWASCPVGSGQIMVSWAGTVELG